LGYVYIMTNRANGSIIKVGRSNDPQRRVKELNAQNYGADLGCRTWEIHTRYRSKSGLSARELENKAHNLLEKFKVHVHAMSDSELFACSPDLAKSFLEKVPATGKNNNSGTSKYQNDVIGEIKCPESGDTHYYAGQTRFNYRSKKLENLTEQEWIHAKVFYDASR